MRLSLAHAGSNDRGLVKTTSGILHTAQRVEGSELSLLILDYSLLSNRVAYFKSTILAVLGCGGKAGERGGRNHMHGGKLNAGSHGQQTCWKNHADHSLFSGG
jgi:hypothetical protein